MQKLDVKSTDKRCASSLITGRDASQATVNTHTGLQLMASMMEGAWGVVGERPSTRMTHAWYNGWLQSLTSKAD